MKTCTKCNKTYSENAFGKKASAKDGLQSHCRNCIQAYNKNYKGSHSKHIKPVVSAYYQKHKETILEYHKKYMQDSIRSANELKRQRCKQRNRRTQKQKIKENYTTKDEQFTIILFNHKCANCESTDNLQIDHHYPLSKGYALTRKNAVLLCRTCNSSKGSKLPEEFYTPKRLSMIEEKLKSSPPPI